MQTRSENPVPNFAGDLLEIIAHLTSDAKWGMSLETFWSVEKREIGEERCQRRGPLASCKLRELLLGLLATLNTSLFAYLSLSLSLSPLLFDEPADGFARKAMRKRAMNGDMFHVSKRCVFQEVRLSRRR